MIWNYVALTRLVGDDAGRGAVPRVVRMAPGLWAAAGCLALAGHAWVRSVPELRRMEAARPLVEARFRDSLAAHDFRRELEEARRVDASIRAGDTSFLYDPFGRVSIPEFALPYLASVERPLARFLPPALSGIGRPALAARLLDTAAAAWPVALVVGCAMIVVGLRRTRPSTEAAPFP